MADTPLKEQENKPVEVNIPEEEVAQKAVEGPQVPEKKEETEIQSSPVKNDATDKTSTDPKAVDSKPEGAMAEVIPQKLSIWQKIKSLKKPKNEGDIKVTPAKVMSPDEVTEALYKQIAEVKADEYVTFRFRKKKILLLLGLGLILLWIMPLGRYLWSIYGGRVYFNGDQLVIVHEELTIITPSPAVAANGPKIRIRNTATESAEVEGIVNLLKNNGYENLEVVSDTESVFAGVGIVVKAGQENLSEKLRALLTDAFPLSTTAAELTTDSDFDAVIFYGKPSTNQ